MTDRRLLEILIDHYDGGPVGIETLAATIGEDSETVEDVYEPFLIQKDLFSALLVVAWLLLLPISI
jgi:Holliday junction resolvasome RuvABC ATP-dependent DNA helicase subunit